MKFIEDHPDYNWDWLEISSNSKITMEFIENHPDYDWDWKYVSYNPNLTWEFIGLILIIIGIGVNFY